MRLDDCKQKMKTLKTIKQNINIPSGRRLPNSPVYGVNVSLPTSTGCPDQKPEMKKNSVFQFLSYVTKELINLQSLPWL